MRKQETFQEAGFLGRRVKRGIHGIRAENSAWFDLACDVNTVLMQVAYKAMDATRGHNWTQGSVAVRLLLRTSGTFQGVILLSERGMVAPARTLVRTIVEDSFCAAALSEKSDEVIKMLRKDSEASRKRQAIFISEQELGNDPELLAKLKAVIQAMEKHPAINWKKMAALGTMLPQYLNYQRLSDGALHTSASSLNEHVARDPHGEGWSYKIGPGKPGDIAATLHRAVLAAIPVCIVTTQIVSDPEGGAALTALSNRFLELPTGNTI